MNYDPFASQFSATERLLESAPFEFTRDNDKLFFSSFQEMALHHYQHNAFFRALWNDRSLHPTQIQDSADLAKVPPMMVSLFKEFTFSSCPEDYIVLVLTSSGTGGQKSQQRLDRWSLENVKKLAFNIHQDLQLTSSQKYNYLCFTYDPAVAQDLGTAFTDELLTSFTERQEIYYAIKWDQGLNDFYFDLDGAVATLDRFARASEPLRILGLPAFLQQVLEKSNRQYHLGPDSWVQTGGGWKQQTGQLMDKSQFRSWVAKRLGIPPGNVRDMFGMVEHGIPYVDCQEGNLHIPNYARVVIRRPSDLAILPDDFEGLIHFFCTYNRSYPAMSLLSTDYGHLHSCGCNLGGKCLAIRGRAGVKKHQGCALSAERLRQQELS